MTRSPRPSSLAWTMALTAASLAALAAVGGAHAQVIQSQPPAEVEGAGITEHRGDSIPLDLEFTNADGRQVRLSEYFDGEKPVVLIFAYFTCPLVCPLVLNNSLDAFRQIDGLTLGADYRALTVSFDHRDTVEQAHQQRDLRLFSYERHKGKDAGAWDFLVGKPRTIRALADAVGFGYRFLPASGTFAHGTAIIVMTPTGEVSNYLYGVKYQPQQLRLALLDAGKGKVGSVFDRIILFCHVYDPESGAYTLQAMRVMQVAGAATVLVLGAILGALFVGERARRRVRARVGAAKVRDAAQPCANMSPGGPQ